MDIIIMPLELDTLIINAHIISMGAMVGLIWFVQLVHYPLFLHIGQGEWPTYHLRHTHQTTWVVAPLMSVELLTGLALAVMSPQQPWLWLNVVLIAVTWLSTAFIQVPLHSQLGKGHDVAIMNRLVATNWIRTAAWTIRGIGWCLLFL
jgi:hypothetical protein